VTPLVLAFAPLALYLALVVPDRRDAWRKQVQSSSERKRAIFLSLLLGLLAALPALLIERWLASWLEVDPKAQVTGNVASILTSLLVFAPLEEAFEVVAVLPMFRLGWIKGGREGLAFASAVAMGFAAVESLVYLRGARADGSLALGLVGALVVLRILLATVARLFSASVWGYLLGRRRAEGGDLEGGRANRTFALAFLAAVAVRGVYDHLVFGKGVSALLGAIPLFLGMIFVAYAARSEFVTNGRRSRGRISFLSSLPPPPSLNAMRAALRRAERPVMPQWILMGGLVTMGVIVTCVVLAVILGRRFGVDFGVVDEGEVTGAVPLSLIGLGVLVAFPVSGYLVARASGAESVLEPALSAALAIVGTLVMLGLAAPVALVFAVAFAPIAFGLACAGAWVGIGGSQA
jgi:RsiW-degrading membrane proteinase PrsW (M82 family)